MHIKRRGIRFSSTVQLGQSNTLKEENPVVAQLFNLSRSCDKVVEESYEVTVRTGCKGEESEFSCQEMVSSLSISPS